MLAQLRESVPGVPTFLGTAERLRLTEIMRTSPASGMFDGDGPTVGEPFSALEERSWRWVRPMTRPQLHRMAGSRSFFITAAEDVRRGIHDEMDELFDELGLHGDATIDLPYVTRAFRAVRA